MYFWLLTKVKIAGYWSSSFFFAHLWTKMELGSINIPKEERGQYQAIMTEQA